MACCDGTSSDALPTAMQRDEYGMNGSCYLQPWLECTVLQDGCAVY
jgi:hypothetical protein